MSGSSKSIPRSAYDVFVSHSKQDQPVAESVCKGLEANGLRCWIAPRDIVPGKTWSDAIIEGVESSATMVVIFSSDANQSQHVQREIEVAISRNIAVIVFRVEDVKPTKGIEYFLGQKQWLNATTRPMEQHIGGLEAVVRAYSSATPVAPPVAEPRNRLWNREFGSMRRVVMIIVAILAARGAYETWSDIRNALGMTEAMKTDALARRKAEMTLIAAALKTYPSFPREMPKSEKDFLAHLKGITKAEMRRACGRTDLDAAAGIHGGKYIVLCGDNRIPPQFLTCVAYESAAEESKGFVVMSDGQIKEVTRDEFIALTLVTHGADMK